MAAVAGVGADGNTPAPTTPPVIPPRQRTMTKTPPAQKTGAVFPDQYEEQLTDKLSKVKDLFAAHKLPPEIEVHRSDLSHFRMRAEFTVWHEGTDLCYVMFEQPDGTEVGGDGPGGGSMSAGAEDAAAADNAAEAEAGSSPPQAEAAAAGEAAAAAPAQAGPLQSNGQPRGKSGKKKKQRQQQGPPRRKVTRVRIDEFPVASQLICSLMPLLRAELMSNEALRLKLFQANFHTTLSNQALITLQYHKQVTGMHVMWVWRAGEGRGAQEKGLGRDSCSRWQLQRGDGCLDQA